MTFEEAWQRVAERNPAISAERVSMPSHALKKMCEAFYKVGHDEGEQRGDISFLQSMMGMGK